MTEIALYNTLRKIPEVSDNEAKEAVADIANSKQVATKSDIKDLKVTAQADIKDMATKADIAEVKADIAEVKTELKADIAEVKADIAEVRRELRRIKWLLSLIFVMQVATLAMI